MLVRPMAWWHRYLKLQVPDISKTEWHPFTISSAPRSQVLTVHIKVTSRADMVSWTAALQSYLREWCEPIPLPLLPLLLLLLHRKRIIPGLPELH
jgi:hypothetical protein